MTIFINTSADFVLMSADVLLKMIIVLSEMRQNQEKNVKKDMTYCSSVSCNCISDLWLSYNIGLVTETFSPSSVSGLDRTSSPVLR